MPETQEEMSFSEFYESVRFAINSDDMESLLELLGKIDSFEEKFLLNYSNRKDEGVYFTQKRISDFIISQTLIELLKNKGFELNGLEEVKIGKNLHPDILHKMKFCDPACGSGIFLLSIIDVLFDLIEKSPQTTNKNKLKHQIIVNISGYDINIISIKLSVLKILKRLTIEEYFDLREILPILECNISKRNVIIQPPSIKFDIIVGNPPYGNILDKSLKKYLKERSYFTKDIYCVFLALALQWSQGTIGFLIPKSFLLRQGYLKFRNDILSQSNLLRIFDIGPNLFKNATNEVQVLIYEKRVNGKKNLVVSEFPKTEKITYQNQIFDDLNICLNKECEMSNRVKKVFPYTRKKECSFCKSKTVPLNRIRIKPNREIFELINKIESNGDLNYINIQDFPKFIRGEEDLGLKKVRKILSDNVKASCYFINAKDDFDYYLMNKNKSFDIESIDSSTLKGDEYEYYTNKKLLIKHNNIIPQALYSEENVCFTSSIYSILHEDLIELKFLCGVINSAVIQFYCLYAINNQTDTTINLNQYMIRHFPIINLAREVKEEISEKVDFIMMYLNNNKGKMDETIYYTIKEIDKILFKSYLLTETEQELLISKVREKIDFFNKIYEKDYDFIFERGWTKIKRAPNF